jgi:hypothetical protein
MERRSILLRLRPEMHAELQRWAADEFRSLNGQIEYLIDQALRQSGRKGAPEGEGSNPDSGGEDSPRSGEQGEPPASAASDSEDGM